MSSLNGVTVFIDSCDDLKTPSTIAYHYECLEKNMK